MKKIVALILPLLCVLVLNAVEFDVDGEFRTRAAMYNNMAEQDGGHIDNRLLLNLNASLHPSLKLVYGIEVGDVRWGDAATGGDVSSNTPNLETNLLYLEHHMDHMNMMMRLGQQYWADHRSLVLDDTFSGVMLSADLVPGFNAEFAYIKPMERNNNVNDDYHVFMAAMTSADKNFGIQSFYGNDMRVGRFAHLTFLPYAVLPLGPLTLDLTGILDYQVYNDADEEIGFGAAVKADAEVGPIGVGGDLLYIGENGLNTIMPYYQNGLYLFGWGKWNDGVTIHFPYPNGDNGMLSAVGNVNFQASEKATAFAHAGYVSTFADDDPGVGFELNAGLEYQIIPDLLTIAGFGALGMPGDHLAGSADMLYLLGSTIQVEF